MSPTTRLVALATALALAALALPGRVVIVALGIVVAAFVVDALLARQSIGLQRAVPSVVTLRNPAPLTVNHDNGRGAHVRLRQPTVADLIVSPSEADGSLSATVTAARRGRHALPAVAARKRGPLGLAAWDFSGDADTTVTVFPDVPHARRIASAVRRGQFRESGQRRRGPLGLGTDFEGIRDYLPDDDVRQINWSASSRVGRPMSNQYRVEQDRDVLCVVDSGRLMGAPVGDRTRLDAAIDAVAAIAYVADEIGDRCGVIAFDEQVRVNLATRRRGADAVVRSIYDLEPRPVDSDYDLAFRTVRNSKRALVIVMSDLLDESAARSLVRAVPVLSNRHAVIVASVTDPDVLGAVTTPPDSAYGVYRADIALDVLDARTRVALQLRAAGAEVVEAAPNSLPEAVVGAYLRLKNSARL